MPALVVPDVHTTAATSDRSDSASQRRPHRVGGQPVVRASPPRARPSRAAEGVHDRGVRVGADDHAQPPAARHRRRAASSRSPGPRPAPRGCPPSRRRRSTRPPDAGSPASSAISRSTVFSAAIGAGRLQPGDALDRGAGDEHVEQQAGLGRSRRDEAEEARAVRGDDARRDHRGVDPEHLVRVPRTVADEAAQPLVQLGGGQRPLVQRDGVHPSRFSAYARTLRTICSVVWSTECI